MSRFPGLEPSLRRDYLARDQRIDATPRRGDPPTRSLAEWRAFEREWAAPR